MPFDAEMSHDGRGRKNALVLDVHEDRIHKRTFGVAVLGMFVHLFRGKLLILYL